MSEQTFSKPAETAPAPISTSNILWGAAATALLGATLAEWQRKREEDAARRAAEYKERLANGRGSYREAAINYQRSLDNFRATLNDAVNKGMSNAEADQLKANVINSGKIGASLGAAQGYIAKKEKEADTQADWIEKQEAANAAILQEALAVQEAQRKAEELQAGLLAYYQGRKAGEVVAVTPQEKEKTSWWGNLLGAGKGLWSAGASIIKEKIVRPVLTSVYPKPTSGLPWADVAAKVVTSIQSQSVNIVNLVSDEFAGLLTQPDEKRNPISSVVTPTPNKTPVLTPNPTPSPYRTPMPNEIRTSPTNRPSLPPRGYPDPNSIPQIPLALSRGGSIDIPHFSSVIGLNLIQWGSTFSASTSLPAGSLIELHEEIAGASSNVERSVKLGPLSLSGHRNVYGMTDYEIGITLDTKQVITANGVTVDFSRSFAIRGESMGGGLLNRVMTFEANYLDYTAQSGAPELPANSAQAGVYVKVAPARLAAAAVVAGVVAVGVYGLWQLLTTSPINTTLPVGN